MSLLAHLRLYYDDWMNHVDEINEIFRSRPPMDFTIYPEEREITARPIISKLSTCITVTTVPETYEVMNLVTYYKEKVGYHVVNVNDYSICFDNEQLQFYAPETIYMDNMHEYMEYLDNSFTIVV